MLLERIAAQAVCCTAVMQARASARLLERIAAPSRVAARLPSTARRSQGVWNVLQRHAVLLHGFYAQLGSRKSSGTYCSAMPLSARLVSKAPEIASRLERIVAHSRFAARLCKQSSGVRKVFWNELQIRAVLSARPVRHSSYVRCASGISYSKVIFVCITDKQKLFGKFTDGHRPLLMHHPYAVSPCASLSRKLFRIRFP